MPGAGDVIISNHRIKSQSCGHVRHHRVIAVSHACLRIKTPSVFRDCNIQIANSVFLMCVFETQICMQFAVNILSSRTVSQTPDIHSDTPS